MISRSALLVLAAALLVLAAGCPKPQTALAPVEAQPLAPAAGTTSDAQGLSGKLTVDVPCGMIIPVNAVIDRFRELNPSVEVMGEFDNANILVDKLVEKGAKADV